MARVPEPPLMQAGLFDFEVAGFTDGFVVNQVVTMPADKIADLKRQLKLNESIIRVMFTTKEA